MPRRTEIVILLGILLVSVVASIVAHDLVENLICWRMMCVAGMSAGVCHWVPLALKRGEQREANRMARL